MLGVNYSAAKSSGKNKERKMNFIKLNSAIHSDPENRRVLVSPWDVSSVCPRKDGGSTIVTKQSFTYKVDESVEEIEDLMRDAFKNAGGKKWEDRSLEE
jgi:hypothetical protein